MLDVMAMARYKSTELYFIIAAVFFLQILGIYKINHTYKNSQFKLTILTSSFERFKDQFIIIMSDQFTNKYINMMSSLSSNTY